MSYVTIRMSTLANLSYEDNLLQQIGGKLIENRSTDTQGFIFSAVDGFDYHQIIFRGSEANIKDWRTNLDSSFGEFGPYLGHQGFINAFESVKRHMWQFISKMPDRPFVLSGHSLGGALAQIAGLALESEGVSVSRVYSYGSPRVFHQDSADEIMENSDIEFVRYVNLLDPVPRLPFRLSLFKHIAKPRLILKNKIVKYPSAWDWVRAGFQSQYPTIKNHSMVQYQDKVSKYSLV